MSTLTLAGHETTANTLTWYLYELAKNPTYQDKLREEVMEVRSRITARGNSDLTIADLDSMVYLPAGMKVCKMSIFETQPMTPSSSRKRLDITLSSTISNVLQAGMM